MKALTVDLTSHLIAAIISVVALTLGPILAYLALVVVGLVVQGDPGGILNFVLVPVGSLLLAIAISALILLPLTTLIQVACDKLRLSPWVPLILMFPASFLVFGGVGWNWLQPPDTGLFWSIITVWCFLGTVSFAVYWIPLIASRAAVGTALDVGTGALNLISGRRRRQ